MSQSQESPNIHVDSDWKAQAEAERQKLEKLEQARAQNEAGGPGEKFPPADFRSIVGLLATQALGGLGAYADPESKRVIVDLPQAQFAIDLLHVLAEKTKGNLTAEELTEITSINNELRARFVHLAQLIAQQAGRGIPTAEANSPGAGGPGAKADPAKPKLIIPG